MKKIDFVIAGQPKSGTTALAHFLSHHPDICVSYPKEPGYFATDFMKESDKFHGKPKYFKARTPEEYEKHFSHAKEGQLLGDASTCYTYSRQAAKNIHTHNPDAKIIIMLRHPVDFMYSLHMQYVNETVENELDFEKALALETDRKKGKNLPPRARCPSYHLYRERTKYADHVKRYIDQFGSENVLIIPNELFRKGNEKTYKEVLKFLGIDSVIMPDFKAIHPSKVPRLKAINKLVHTMWFKNTLYKLLGPALYTKIHKQVNKLLLKPRKRKNLGDDLRKYLTKKTVNDVYKLDQVTGKKFSHIWSYDKISGIKNEQ